MYNWKEEQFKKNVAMFSDAVVTDGIPRWKSNNSIPMSDMLDDWKSAGLKFDYDKSIAARNLEVEQELREYREKARDRKYSEEELIEMQSEFGIGTTVVDVITGAEIRL